MRKLIFPALALSIFAAGCHTDMWVQPKARVQGSSDFFADGRDSRPKIAGTVARGQQLGCLPPVDLHLPAAEVQLEQRADRARQQGGEGAFAPISPGEQRTLLIPWWLAYGETGKGPTPAKATLRFEVELLEVR